MHKRIIIIFVILLLIPIGTIAAQEIPDDGPIYIVQSGDTLTAIAARFGISIQDIMAANGMTDTSILRIGAELRLPGVDWLSGTLVPMTIQLGENLLSLSRRYGTSVEALARLNRNPNPSAYFYGKEVLIPIQDEGYQSYQRSLVEPAQTLLEIAILTNDNPWRLVSTNNLKGTWDAMPGDVLLSISSDEDGPGGFPDVILETTISPSSPIQGRTVVVQVQTTEEIHLGGLLAGENLNFFRFDSLVEDGIAYVALQGVHAMIEPGLYPLTLNGRLADGSMFEYSQLIRVIEAGYGYETLTVSEDYLIPEITEQESQFVADLVSIANPDRLWQGYFQPPSPYGDCYNSLFGTRRSYNKSDFNYFHAGLDFCGGLGVEIYAPAEGVVVFADELEIRGNATIIDHGWGIYSGYWHQSEIFVEVGDLVQIGQIIGLVGSTGRSTGAHLHWEMWAGGVQVDPLEWLGAAFP